VVGASNELAYAACQAVARRRLKIQPPLLTGRRARRPPHAGGGNRYAARPSKRMSTPQVKFTHEFISAIKKEKLGFVDKYRNVDGSS